MSCKLYLPKDGKYLDCLAQNVLTIMKEVLQNTAGMLPGNYLYGGHPRDGSKDSNMSETFPYIGMIEVNFCNSSLE